MVAVKGIPGHGTLEDEQLSLRERAQSVRNRAGCGHVYDRRDQSYEACFGLCDSVVQDWLVRSGPNVAVTALSQLALDRRVIDSTAGEDPYPFRDSGWPASMP